MGKHRWQFRRRMFVNLLLTSLVLLTSACTANQAGKLPSKDQNPTLTPFQPLPKGTQFSLAPTPVPAYSPVPTKQVTATQHATATQSPAATTTNNSPSPSLTSTSPPATATAAFTLWIDPLLPESLRHSVTLPPDTALVESRDQAVLRLEFGSERQLAQWVFALVAPFPTMQNGISAEMLRRFWRGEGEGLFPGKPLLMDESTLAGLSALWGAPAPQAVQTLGAQELLDYAWGHQPAWAVVPFEALEPRWKVLEINGQSPLHKEFDPAAYALTVPVSLNGDTALAETMHSAYSHSLAPATNRDPGKLTVLAMTGVTALVRGTAFAMERKGVLYPAKDVGDLLRSADLTHISNEVPFADGCPYPDPLQPDMRFCSDPKYITLLEEVGADIVELTGDHFQDWGKQAMLLTLQLYRERGWKYFGGGENLDEAQQAVLVEHNGNRLAFIGCNAKGGGYAQAAANHPGAAACGYDFMANEIARMSSQGYLPIATFQHFEYYTYAPQGSQKRDFRRMAQAGAVIVSGSQAHQPQALEFNAGALIHYGLGNLFFDQYDVSPATRQAFIDRHVFYDGRYIGVELLPIMFVDYARPRPMTEAERKELLEAVFKASGW